MDGDVPIKDSSLQPGTSSQVKSADRVLRVLELLAKRATPQPTMAIARDCGVPKSSMHHLLNVMLARNFVAYFEADRTWGLGVAAFEIGSAYLRSEPLQRLGRPRLVAVTAQTGETSHLAVLRGVDVVYLDKEQPRTNAPKLVTEVGVRLPAHLTSVGIAILAHLPAAQLRAIYADQALTNRTGSGPRNEVELQRLLRACRDAGYAQDLQMTTRGISCIAAPVFSWDGTPTAAIGITFLAEAYRPAELDELSHVIVHESRKLSRSLGYREEDPSLRPRLVGMHPSRM